ncbi:hypothetical protein NITHO_900005 [Nitrolancea hollandica Lb]|uniref:Uncharacterized protein n=1 Tax=Nitrolancea hollandica Lb TaxID=1129897 RepID=I4ENG7_9BACT|nr:hypothetical protein NITHO_900005 [Nitrolancea hollandica Lb]
MEVRVRQYDELLGLEFRVRHDGVSFLQQQGGMSAHTDTLASLAYGNADSAVWIC